MRVCGGIGSARPGVRRAGLPGGGYGRSVVETRRAPAAKARCVSPRHVSDNGGGHALTGPTGCPTAGGRAVSVGACAKGSGMIHPNMATMLGVLTCDAAVAPEVWRDIVRTASVKRCGPRRRNPSHMRVLQRCF